MIVSPLIVRAHQGESLDALVWRSTGRDSGVVEAVLDANRGIAVTGTALAEGTPVLIPANLITLNASPLVIDTVQLWD